WGLEFEALWSPTRNFRLNANLGLLESRIGNGERSIDLMSRTADNPDYTLVKPWMQLPSNCVLPTTVVQDFLQTQGGMPSYFVLCGGWAFGTLLGGSINP